MRTLQNELKDKGFAKDQVVKEPKKQSTQFSRREIEKLMGIKRDTYKRINGSVRRK